MPDGPRNKNEYRLGYCALSSGFSYSRDITESLVRAAEDERIGLITLDNGFSAKRAIRNAEMLVREKVDLVLEHQGDEHVSTVVASKFLDAGIPMIAIHVPHPGATYFGPDNYNSGLMGGRYLGRWVKQNWNGQVDYMILLALTPAGLFARSRLSGTVVGLREIVPDLGDSRVLFLNGQGQYGPSLELVRKHVRRRGTGRTLICDINDPSTIGGVRAFEEAGEPRSVSATCRGRKSVRSRRVGYERRPGGDGLCRAR